jgi:hypothetical protein
LNTKNWIDCYLKILICDEWCNILIELNILQGEMIVWMDVMDETLPVPTHDGYIFMKASRIKITMPNKPSPPANGATKAVPTTTQASVTVSSSTSKPSVERKNSEKLIKFDDLNSSTKAPPLQSEFDMLMTSLMSNVPVHFHCI